MGSQAQKESSNNKIAMSKSKSKPLDKRKFKRLNTSLNVKFKIVSGENPTKISSMVNGITKDLSSSGLGLETAFVQIDRLHISHDSSMMVKSRLDIELEIQREDGNNAPKTIHLVGETAWYDRKDTNPQYPYNVGVKILEISKEDQAILDSFINNS